MFAHVLAVFTALYDARSACRSAAGTLPQDTLLCSLVSGASGALDLAEDYLSRRSIAEGKERIQTAVELLDEALELGDDAGVQHARAETVEVLRRLEGFPTS